jgi:hypothetical protein
LNENLAKAFANGTNPEDLLISSLSIDAKRDAKAETRWRLTGAAQPRSRRAIISRGDRKVCY